MKISGHIMKEAENILVRGGKLPHQIASAQHFYLAEDNDSTIHAFSVLIYNKKQYKIGTLKKSTQ